MNSVLRYSQFIYGKLATVQDSGYCLVARTADLSDEDQLRNMAENTHRFWGGRPPVRDNIKAAGIFLHENNLVLVQASTAVNPHTKQHLLSGTREFNQHRYVFIPIDSIASLEGKTFKLLYWILQQPIPIQSQFESNLLPLQIPLLEQKETSEQEVNNFPPCLNNINSQQRWLLSAQDQLISGKRLLLTLDGSITPEDFIKSILLLLPTAYRSNISVAIGTVEEQHCGWAQLIIKSSGNPQGRLPENMIWVNKNISEWNSLSEHNQFKSNYVSLINCIVKSPEKVPQLLQKLDVITDKDITLNNLNNSKVIISLIQLLPHEQQAAMRKQYLSGLKSQQWQSLIPLIQDDKEGLLFAWEELGGAATSQEYISLMFDVWKQLGTNEKIEILQKLQLEEKLPLTETLLQNGLIEQPITKAETTAISFNLIKLCKCVVANKSRQDFKKAWQFATYLITKKIFEKESDRFWLLDQAFSENITVDHLHDAFNFKIAFLLPHIEPVKIHESNIYKNLQSKNPQATKLLNAIIEQRNAVLEKLPQLAKQTNMNLPAQDQMYAAFLINWSPSFEEAGELLASLIQQLQLFDNNFNRQQLQNTCGWFENKKPELRDIFSHLEQTDIVWNTWDKLAQVLYIEPIKYIKFLDNLLKDKFTLEILQKWLPIIANDESTKSEFLTTSLAWKSLKQEDLNILVGQENVITLTRCLQDSGRFNWINGNVLHYLIENWIEQGRIDNNLKILITRPNVIQSFCIEDWFRLIEVSWKPGFNLELPLYKLPLKSCLTPVEKQVLANSAIKYINQYFTVPERTERILNDCEILGLSLPEIKKILLTVQERAINFDLVFNYIIRDISAINSEQDIPWIFSQMGRLETETLIHLLRDRLTQNLPLAEILLNHGLYKQNYLHHNDKVVSQLRILCQRVVEYKSKEDWNQAWEFVKQITRSEIFHHDSYQLQLLNAAYPNRTTAIDKQLLLEYSKAIVKLYTRPEQTQELLNDSKTWGLGINEQTEILKIAPSLARNFDLIKPYLELHSGIKPSENISLVQIFLQIQPQNNSEQQIYTKFIQNILFWEIQSCSRYIWLTYILNNAVDKQLCIEAFELITKSLISTHLNQLIHCVQNLYNDSQVEITWRLKAKEILMNSIENFVTSHKTV